MEDKDKARCRHVGQNSARKKGGRYGKIRIGESQNQEYGAQQSVMVPDPAASSPADNSIVLTKLQNSDYDKDLTEALEEVSLGVFGKFDVAIVEINKQPLDE